MVNKAKQASVQDGQRFLFDAFGRVQGRLEYDLRHAAETVTHDGNLGEVSESSWLKVIQSYLPRRYGATRGIIIDSDGQVSDQIDIIIFDPQYTPALLTLENNRYIPAEAVYAVLEAKPQINKGYLEYAGGKVASVRRLKRTSVPIAHAGGVFPAKELFSIIGGIVPPKVNWRDGLGKSFKKIMASAAMSGLHRLDCGCGLSHGAFDRFDTGEVTVFDKRDVCFVLFWFRFLKKLQSLGTVPAIDWNVYSAVLESKDIG